MKLTALLGAAAIVAVIVTPAHAQAQYDQPSWLETPSEMRQRHEADLYDQYRTRRDQGRDWDTLGGYTLRSGELLRSGTERPGYSDPPRTDAYGNPTSPYR